MIKRVIISGGGTGGHIFPAIAIANELKARNADVEILFVGAIGKMEMEKVPAAGYEIVGLPIAGLQRKLSIENLKLPFKLIKSFWKAYQLIKKFKPEVVIGVGGYASAATLMAANQLGVPTLIQEQNSFPGKTNKLLANKAKSICTAYEGLDAFFPAQKISLTGNPVRKEVAEIESKREEAFSFFGLNPALKTILVVGGSLGARTLNDSVMRNIELLRNENIQVIWQSGKSQYATLKDALNNISHDGIVLHEFIFRMDLAYAAADVIISRAGAIAVSELALVGKAVILVPSPNVAEDHQTKNAMALVNKGAAILVKDIEAREILMSEALKLLKDTSTQHWLSQQIASLGKPNATSEIVDQIEKIKGVKA